MSDWNWDNMEEVVENMKKETVKTFKKFIPPEEREDLEVELTGLGFAFKAKEKDLYITQKVGDWGEDEES